MSALADGFKAEVNEMTRNELKALNLLTEAALHPESVAAKRVRDGAVEELLPPGDDEYTTGTKQDLVGVHPETDDCRKHGCPIHAPSDHIMRDFPTHWRADRGLMERICPHGVGHPDPDHIGFTARTQGLDAAQTEGVHGCDGCCHGNGPPGPTPEALEETWMESISAAFPPRAANK